MSKDQFLVQESPAISLAQPKVYNFMVKSLAIGVLLVKKNNQELTKKKKESKIELHGCLSVERGRQI